MSLPADRRAGTSAFTAAAREGPFCPDGIKAAGCLTRRAAKFHPVERGNTSYRLPASPQSTVGAPRHGRGFVFAAKVLQPITQVIVLVDCEVDRKYFLQSWMSCTTISDRFLSRSDR